MAKDIDSKLDDILDIGTNIQKETKVVKLPARAESVDCLLYTSPSPRDATLSRMPSSA